jgi:drug/metabolite transporter (DMT)-like permease
MYRTTAVGTAHGSALVFGALRTLPPAVLFLILLRGRLPRLTARTFALLAVSGLLTVTVYVYALTEGVARAGAGNTAVLSNATPLFVAGAVWMVPHERLSLRRLFAIVAGFGGVVLMFASEIHLGDEAAVGGMAITLVAAAAWGAATVLVKRVIAREPGLDALTVVAVQYLAGCPLLLLMSAGLAGGRGTDWASGAFWAAVGGAGIAAAVGALCYFGALRSLSTTRVTTSQFLIPAVAILIEIGFGSPPGLLASIGIAVTVASVAAVSSPENHQAVCRS